MEAEGWKKAVCHVKHKRTRAGRLLRIVSEKYLRMDVSCLLEACSSCPRSEIGTGTALVPASAKFVAVPDADVLLAQPDVFAAQGFPAPLLLLQSVMERVREASPGVFARLVRELLASRRAFLFMNEHHALLASTSTSRKHAFAACLRWYASHAPSTMLLPLTTAANLTKHTKLPHVPQSMQQFFAANPNAALADLVANETAPLDTVASDSPRLRGESLAAALQSGEVQRCLIRVWACGHMASCTLADGSRPRIRGFEAIGRATDGDEVAVKLVNEATASGDGGVFARVVAVLKRNWRPLAGSMLLEDNASALGRTTAWFVPISRAFPRVRVQTKRVADLVGKRVVVRLDAWDERERFPRGHVLEVLGAIGERDVETRALMVEHEIRDVPFSDEALRECPAVDWKVSPEDVVGRIDRRDQRVFSIDPPGCTDIDDALHIRRLENHRWEVGVHIADVCAFVGEGGAIDVEAQRRCTSVYLVERRIDMIPARLSTTICSLRADVDRLAFSVVWTLDDDANIVDVRFEKTVIRSVAALAYADAQKHIDDVHHEEENEDNIAGDCRALHRLAQRLRRRRLDAGALTLASPAVKFLLDSQREQPTDIASYESGTANALVEEFMLLANISVAERLRKTFPSRALLRRHPAPDADNLVRLVNAAASAGVHLDVASSKTLASSLDAAKDDNDEDNSKQRDIALRMFTTRCMNQALYMCSGGASDGFAHYGLALPLYTHFTSPIRRYADVIVHRLLQASLGLSPMPNACRNKAALAELAHTLNTRNRAARMCGRASVQLYTLLYFAKQKRPVEADAIVVDIGEQDVSVFVPQFGVDGRLRLVDEEIDEVIRERAEIDAGAGEREQEEREQRDEDRVAEKQADELAFDARKMTMLTKQARFHMFQAIRVRIVVKELKFGRRKLVIECIDSSSGAPPAAKRARTE